MEYLKTRKNSSKVHWPLTRLERLSVYKARCVLWPQFSQKTPKKLTFFYGETLHVFTCIATSCKYCHTSIVNFQGYLHMAVKRSVNPGGHVLIRWAQFGSLVDIGSTDLPKTGEGRGHVQPPCPWWPMALLHGCYVVSWHQSRLGKMSWKVINTIFVRHMYLRIFILGMKNYFDFWLSDCKP